MCKSKMIATCTALVCPLYPHPRFPRITASTRPTLIRPILSDAFPVMIKNKFWNKKDGKIKKLFCKAQRAPKIHVWLGMGG